MPDAEVLSAALAGGVIFSRVAPEDKMRIVSLVRASGEVVAVTGDGINDAPALRHADIGVAMGRTGTDVAKDAAEVVLLDDSFATLVEAVSQGRTIYTNISRGVLSCLTSNIAEFVVNMVSLVLTALLGLPLALNVLQILAIDVLGEIIPISALGADRAEGENMHRPPRDPRSRILDRRALGDVLATGTVMGALAIGAFLVAFPLQGMAVGRGDATQVAAATTVTYVTILMYQLVNIVQRRSVHGILSRHQLTNRRFWVACLLALGILGIIVCVPPNLVCVDIDGTLINSRQEVPESSRRAVRAGIDAGNIFVLCTGRSLPEVYPWVWDIGFEGIIGGAGAFTRMGGHVVSDHRITRGDVEVVSTWLDGQDLPWAWQTPDRFHPSDSFMEAFAGASGAEEADPDDDWTPYLHQVGKAVRRGLPDSASKGIFMLPAGSTFDPDFVPRATGGRLRTISGSVEAATGTTCEILLSGVDKGSALVGLAEHLGIPLDRTVAIGDSVNDIEALGAAGTGVAMGNASPAVKEVADVVTDDIDEEGLAHALRGLGLTA